MDVKKIIILSINSCLQNGKQSISLAENRDSSELTAILKGARQGIHNWKKEKTYAVVVTHLLPSTFDYLGGVIEHRKVRGSFVSVQHSSISTTAGLGYFQVSEDYPCKSPPGVFDSVCTVNTH